MTTIPISGTLTLANGSVTTTIFSIPSIVTGQIYTGNFIVTMVDDRANCMACSMNNSNYASFEYSFTIYCFSSLGPSCTIVTNVPVVGNLALVQRYISPQGNANLPSSHYPSIFCYGYPGTANFNVDPFNIGTPCFGSNGNTKYTITGSYQIGHN